MTRVRRIQSVLAVSAAAVAVAFIVATGPAASQEKADNAEPAVEKKQRKQPRGRLPDYYRQVVSEKQREEIYKIQASYQAKIAALQAQLKAVVDERNARVAGVLTPEQEKKVEELAAAAKAKRKKGREKPAEPKVGG